MIKEGVLIQENFLSATQCKVLRGLYNDYHTKVKGLDYNRRPTVHYLDIQSPIDQMRKYNFRSAAERAVQKAADVSGMKLFPEAVFLAKIGVGERHPLHCDNVEVGQDGKWRPNHTPQRDYSALIYLNSDFSGGELHLPGRFEIKPEEGLLVGFPSTQDFPHEVYPVTDGVRYSLPVWMTKDTRFRLHLL